jgi:hypothetical protein
MDNIRLNIFTCCNKEYKNFIPLFIISNLFHNKNTFVEICVDELDLDKLDLKESIEYLNKLYINRFLIRKIKFEKISINDKLYNVIPNTVRFITEPRIKSEYVYISDIDIITLEGDICDMHISHMNNKSLPFSNIVRPYDVNQNYRRLTGLHFTPYDNYYPIPNYDDLISNGVFSRSDEIFLYELVKKRFNNIDEETKWRPVHGIHVSPNRNPIGEMNWGMNNWKKQWLSFRKSPEFLGLELTLNDYIKDKIMTIDKYYNLK